MLKVKIIQRFTKLHWVRTPSLRMYHFEQMCCCCEALVAEGELLLMFSNFYNCYSIYLERRRTNDFFGFMNKSGNKSQDEVAD